MAPSYQLRIDAGALRVLIEKTHILATGGSSREIGLLIRNAGEMVRTRAVWNVSGFPVVYQGGVFRVMVRTGALKGSIELQWPYQSAYQARVFVNGTMTGIPWGAGGFVQKPRPVSEYAASIEFGHKAIDLKKTMLGKTVPFFASRTGNTRGPFAARGLEPLGADKVGGKYRSSAHDAKLAAAGKGPMTFTRKGGKSGYATHGGGSYYIAFRKVGKTGWIIPAAKPRPFLGAAVENTRTPIRRMMVNGVVAMLRPGG